ncbi:MAG: DNA sulfur modification protein DndB [Myxococcota bacterium]|nr:DNA sulfur modification protein DndB [Myxococcota bacterium]
MKIMFPAMRGTIGQRTYYSTLMPLSAVPRMFTFTDWAEFLPEDREQRVLNTKRIPEIAQYILENEEGYLFSSITASYRAGVKYLPSADSESIGVIEMDMRGANFVINDGQHRAEAIKLALESNPALGEETISVLLFAYENRDRVQQMFSDLNRFVKKTSKSLDILYDKRDLMAQVTGDVADLVPAFKGYVEKDYASLPAGSKNLFSLAALYDATKELLSGPVTRDRTRNELANLAIDFWNTVGTQIPDWQRVRDGKMLARELRQESLSSHSVVLRAIGAVGSELLAESPDPMEWKKRLTALADVDWSKRNREWENVNMVANSVVSNRQARLATKAYLKRKLGLTLTDAEDRSITPPLAAE